MKEQVREGYMCRADFAHELGEASGGNEVYPTLEDLRSNRPCVDQCGIVKVRVTLIEHVTEAMA